MRLLAALIGCLPVMALADTPMVDPARVLSSMTHDWNGDGWPDRAVLVESDADAAAADLYIALGIPDTGGFAHVVFAPTIAWRGAASGQIPFLEVRDGALVLQSMNDAYGRQHWWQSLTITYRAPDFVVTRFTYDSWDVTAPDAQLVCDVDLDTGRGIATKGDSTPVGFVTLYQTLPASEWDAAYVPHECFE